MRASQLVPSLLLAASMLCTAQNSSPKQPDEVLLNRAMLAMVEGKFDVANLTLRTFLNTYPSSRYAAEASELLTDPRVARCEGTWFVGPSVCDVSNAINLDREHTTWIEEALRSAETVKTGMTRSDLMTVFTTEGGLSSSSQRTYVYRRCPYIKVDVKFAADGNEERQADKIVSISRPYLAWSIRD